MAGFVDEAQLHVKAGNGGAGSVAFRREAHVSKGGPDGGDGGRGGDVWLVAAPGVASLLGFRDHPHRRAGDGGHGGGKQRRGANGTDMEVKVPLGTTVRRLDGSAVADLREEGERALVVSGGRGGRGNARFLTNRRRAPAFAEQAEIGEELWLNLELRLLADVALVGFPNVGKSTYISAVSAAKPKIADYPFTTLEPHLGVVVTGRQGDETEFVVADIPGLVEGAAEGKGLGHQFLRHIERARVLLLLLDLAPEALAVDEQERILLSELERYRPELLDRPRVVCGSRADLVGESERDQIKKNMTVISAVTGLGMTELTGKLARLVVEARSFDSGLGSDMTIGRPPASMTPGGEEGEHQGIFVHRPLGETPIEITRGPDGVFEVIGRQALRAVALSDLTDDDALDLVQARLRRLGVERALVKAGVRDGDFVRVGELAFTYHPDDLQHEEFFPSEGRGGKPAKPTRRQGRAARDQ
jgi:GTP-binding protein